MRGFLLGAGFLHNRIGKGKRRIDVLEATGIVVVPTTARRSYQTPCIKRQPVVAGEAEVVRPLSPRWHLVRRKDDECLT